MLLARLGLALVSLALPACLLFGEPEPEPACTIDATTPIMPVFSNAYGVLADVTDGGEVPLIPAPQGGYILCIGARVQLETQHGCGVTINAAVRDVGNGRVVGLEQRPMVVDRKPDGWAWPPDPAGLSDLANVAVCPNGTASGDLFDNPYQLEVKLLDADEQILLETTTMFTPTCQSTYCRQECAH